MSALTGVAAGVPFLAVPPDTAEPGSAPVVVGWHLMDAPRTEAAFAAALPLAGLDAWRIYLGLPLYGSRLPAGGQEELMRLGFQDAVVNLQGPVSAQAVAEFPAAYAALRDRLGIGARPAALFGGSLGAAVAQQVVAEGAAEPTALVLVSPLVQLRPVVAAASAFYGISYEWSPASDEIARRLDFVARADEIAKSQPAVRVVVGAEDDRDGILAPADRLVAALRERYADPARVDLVTVPDMAHALAEEPGTEPAPQTPHAAAVDRHAVQWLRRQLGTG